ncbi:MAG: carboxypeptidase-like regulatory domain-containing protein, partial [Ferruginibacter sp.]|nr:carboxypeptidase-like regulatory domain-containing protein [Ferruginibacter sp.]
MKKRNFLPNLSPVFIILALLISNALSAQQSLVSGRVVNQDNAPLSGATVSIRGTKLATRTSENGTFSFNNVPLKKIVLTVSYVGYQAKDVTFRAGEETQVSLVESTLDGDEVIVTGVFDKRKKLEASVAITTISARQIARIVPASAADLLKNVPGVYVNSSLGEIRNTVYSRGVSVGSNDGASGYYYVSMQEDGLPVTNATYGNYGPDYFLRADATIGRVEAVRGGTASILGANAPGGIFNYVSKEGGAKTAGEIRTKYGLEGNGKNDFFRTDFNLGGPLGNNWYYNVGGFYRQAQGARYPGYAINNGGQFKANIVKKYSTGSLKIYGKYLNDKNGWFEFTPTVGFSDPKPATGFDENSSVLSPAIKQHFPINQTGRTGTYNNADLIHSVDKSAGLNWEQRLGDGWTFTNAMRYSDKSATWNTNAVVYPLDMGNLISYAILGQLGRPGTYSFRGLNSGRELLSVKSFSGFDFNVTANSLPGNTVAPNSLFFEPMIFQTNNVKEFLDQFAISKKINKMSFTAGGYYGNSKVDRLGGTAGLGLATIQDRPELVSITLTNPDSSISQLTNSNGIMGTGGGLSLN